MRGTLVPEPLATYRAGPITLNADGPLPEVSGLRVWGGTVTPADSQVRFAGGAQIGQGSRCSGLRCSG